jgi:hypothetical protein
MGPNARPTAAKVAMAIDLLFMDVAPVCDVRRVTKFDRRRGEVLVQAF